MTKSAILLFLSLTSCGLMTEKSREIKYHELSYSKIDTSDYLIRVSGEDPFFELGVPFAFVNSRGDTIIPSNKYDFTWTDTLKSFAIVSKAGSGMIAIDRYEHVLYEVFSYDNGPDDLSDGLFRVIRNGKIGYADQNGVVVIPCQFNCAYYFENGKAKVSKDCKSIKEGEYTKWESNSWHHIDKTGKVLE